ncbi:hypothetical protein JCM1841_004628 [Sporobolomyces salmonicolor]
MRFSTTALSLVTLAASTVSAACHAGHRRHHAKLASSVIASASSTSASAWSAQTGVVAAAKWKSNSNSTWSSSSVDWNSGSSSTGGSSSWSSSGSATSTASASSSSSTSSSSSSSSSSTLGWGLAGVKKNNIYIGFLPDDGSGGGTAQTISEINSAIGGTSAAQGWYAQAQSGTLFDGSQFSYRKDQIVSGGVFQPAVMPTGGWWGLTSDDNQQAVAICKVMQEYVDLGVEVWLRFAHEVNYYQTDGTYQGTAADFKEGWATVAAACKQYAPTVKMWFTPNVASLSEYEEYYPDDPSTVDIIGVDWYPMATSDFDFAYGSANMQAFHDKYTSADGTKFAIGETGLGETATMAQRLAWLQNIVDSSSTMTNMIAVSWFNYYKGYDFRIAAVSGDSIVQAYLAGSS